jgi:GT2 family glycosyltransferase
MLDWDHLTSREVDQVMGAFTLIRRPLFQRLGGYDERFFVYMEDLDLALRARKLGFKSVYLAEAAVFHTGGGTAANVPAESLFFSLRSRMQYGFKHFAPPEAFALLLLTMLLEPLTRLCFALARRSLETAAVTARAYVKLWLAIPRLRARR